MACGVGSRLSSRGGTFPELPVMGVLVLNSVFGDRGDGTITERDG
jgi:hypothetical protein